MQKIRNDLEVDFMILREWLHENHMLVNPGECNYIMIRDNEWLVPQNNFEQ